MEGFNTWRLDTPIKRNSKFKWLIITCWLAILLWMVVLFKLAWWQATIVIMSGVFVMLLASWWRYPVIHLTQPSTHNKNKLWQIYIGHKKHNPWSSIFLMFTKNQYDNHAQINDKIMWQGDLCDAKDFGNWVLLRFQVVEPFARPLTLVIFRDQIEPVLSTSMQDKKNGDKYHDNWRLLKTIARLSRNK